MIALLVFAWMAFCGGFVAGCLWVSRRPEPQKPQMPDPTFRRVARPCVVARVNLPECDYVAVAADYIAKRDEFGPTDRAVLDSLVLVDALMRGKW